MRRVALGIALLFLLAPIASAEQGQSCKDDRDNCKDSCNERADRCEPRPTTRPIASDADSYDGRWIAVERNGHLHNFTVDGVRVLDAIEHRATFEGKKDGARLQFSLGGDKLILTDSRTGHVAYRGDSPIHLQFPIGTTVDGRFVEGPGFMGRLEGKFVADGAHVKGTEIKFHVLPPQAAAAQSEVRDKMAQAIEDRHVAGEVRIGKDSDEVLVYDDVNVTVGGTNETLRVVFDADLDSGRTFVIDVDPELITGPELELRYYDLNDDGTETEVVFRMADSLADILDPTDDAGQPEYWVVKDANGLQVMVSVPHWSTHAITLSSLGEFVTQPSVLIGVAAGIAGVGVAAITLMRPRRD